MAMIEINKDFQYSVNIKYDYSDSSKIGKYIFTPNTVEILKTLFNVVEGDSQTKANFLIGAYGKGKSHLMLILLNLLSLNDSKEITFAREKIAKIDKDFENRISHYYQNQKKVLKVIVDGNNSISLPNLFMKSLMTALENENLSEFVPDNFFSAVTNTIESWKNAYQNTYQNFLEKLKSKNEEIETFISKINNFDENAYKTFLEIYPELTSGSKFSPEVNGNVVEIYESVAKKLSTKNYKGIYLVFDEFSKYLESNIEKNFDTKFLQDFAEMTSKTKNDRQIHALFITHKAFYNYLPKNLVNTWKTIAGRFNEIHLDSSLSQTFEVISKVINHDKNEFEEFKNQYKSEFDKNFEIWSNEPIFQKIESKEKLFENIFPLHPSSLFALPLLSEKSAQNERTIFTFLASDSQNFTLSDFVKKNGLNGFKNQKIQNAFLTPDFLFDYFSPIFSQFSFDNEIFKTNVKCTTALSKLDGENFLLHRKIVKTIAILLLVGTIECNEKTIVNIFGEKSKDSLNYLLKNGILIHFEFSNTLKFPEYNSLDIEKRISEEIKKLERLSSKENLLSKILTEYSKTTAIYPVGYNDDNSVTRFLRIRFSNQDKEIEENDSEKKFCDGTILCLVNCDESKFKSSKNKKLLVKVLLKNSTDSQKIENYALKYEASRQLYEELLSKNDKETAEVIKSVYEDYEKFLEKLLDSFISFDEKNIVFVDDEKINVKNKIEFDEKISSWFSAHFEKFPIILNEFVNRNKISAQTEKSVKGILNALFTDGILLENLGFSKGSQEATILKSVFVKNKVFKNRNNEWTFEPFHSDVKKTNKNLYSTFEIIKKFIDCSTERQKIEELYKILITEIGLRKGLIPLLFGAVLRSEKNVYFVKKNSSTTEPTKEFAVSSEILLEINKNPQVFEIQKINLDSKMEKLLSELKTTFADFIKGKSNEEIVKGMSKWFISLPKYTNSNLSKDDKNLFSELGKSFINSNEYLLKLNKIENLNIQNRKEKIDSFIKNTIQEIKVEFYKIFNATDDSSLDSKISEWFQSLSAETRNYVFKEFVSNVIAIFAGKHSDIDSFIRELSIKIIGVPIENWNAKYDNEDSIEFFKKRIREFKKSYDKQQEIQTKQKQGLIEDGTANISEKLCAVQYSKDGKKIVKTFDFIGENEKLSLQARLLKNEMQNNLKEYQNSLSQAEKCGVLFNLIREILEN